MLPIGEDARAALMIFLRALVRNEPVYLCGLIPGLIGIALLVYGLLLAPKSGDERQR